MCLSGQWWCSHWVPLPASFNRYCAAASMSQAHGPPRPGPFSVWRGGVRTVLDRVGKGRPLCSMRVRRSGNELETKHFSLHCLGSRCYWPHFTKRVRLPEVQIVPSFQLAKKTFTAHPLPVPILAMLYHPIVSAGSRTAEDHGIRLKRRRIQAKGWRTRKERWLRGEGEFEEVSLPCSSLAASLSLSTALGWGR